MTAAKRNEMLAAINANAEAKKFMDSLYDLYTSNCALFAREITEDKIDQIIELVYDKYFA